MLSFEDKTVPNSSILVKLISPAHSAVGCGYQASRRTGDCHIRRLFRGACGVVLAIHIQKMEAL